MAISAGLAILIGSILSAVLGGGASIANSAIQKNAQDEANKANIDLANATNQTQIELANTAHQREMADLKKAGLNPVLTATGGNGAATPGLTTASVSPAGFDMSGIATAMTSMSNMMLLSLLMSKGGGFINSSKYRSNMSLKQKNKFARKYGLKDWNDVQRVAHLPWLD